MASGCALLAFGASIPTAHAVDRTWATYYGGSGSDMANDTALDSLDSVLVVGSTNSTSDISTDHSSFGGGNDDGFIAKFDEFGALDWGRYRGGSGDDSFINVAIDSNDNVIALGSTNSTNGIATPGAWKSTLTGSYDAFLAKYTPLGAPSWVTYLGGDGADFGWASCVTSNGTTYVVGSTTSTDLGLGSPHDVGFNGVEDAFIAKVGSNGTPTWISYYGHSSGSTTARDCAVDSSDNVYIVGYTTATSGLTTVGTHDPSHDGDQDVFLARFNSSGTLLWGTYYGGSETDRGYAIGLDEEGDVYISGSTASSNDGHLRQIATDGAHSEVLAGAQDAFVAKFDGSNGARVWGTYFGSENSGSEISHDALYDLEVDTTGIALAGTTNSDDPLLSTSDAYDQIYGDWIDPLFLNMSIDGDVWYCSYNGGTGIEPGDHGTGVALSFNEAVLTGRTLATGGIATTGAHDTSHNGSHDVFITFITLFIT